MPLLIKIWLLEIGLKYIVQVIRQPGLLRPTEYLNLNGHEQ